MKSFSITSYWLTRFREGNNFTLMFFLKSLIRLMRLMQRWWLNSLFLVSFSWSAAMFGVSLASGAWCGPLICRTTVLWEAPICWTTVLREAPILLIRVEINSREQKKDALGPFLWVLERLIYIIFVGKPLLIKVLQYSYRRRDTCSPPLCERDAGVVTLEPILFLYYS